MIPTPRNLALHYDKAAWDAVTCRICPHLCSIAPSRSGACGVRTNRGGELYVDNYGKVAALDVMEGEDLPLYHFIPGSNWLRVGLKGCTMRCPFCNTWRHSLAGSVRTEAVEPGQLVELALTHRVRGISFGVNEPAPAFEYVMETFTQARKAGLHTHLQTCGLWCEDPLREIADVTSAVTLGLKGLNANLYQQTLGGDQQNILNTLDILLAVGVDTEISWLVIPGRTDDVLQAQELVRFLEARQATPPILLLPMESSYTWDQEPPTTLAQLMQFRACFENYPGITYVLHPESALQNTRCTKCNRTLVRRGEARLVITSFPSGLPKNDCPGCGTKVPYRTE